MFRRFRAWLRVVLPAENALFGALILTLAPVLYAGIRSRLGADTDWEEGLPTLVPLLSAVIYGVFRAVYFNPMEHRAYGAWLSESPWQFPRPLPLGPLHLVWQDLFIVGLLTAIFPHDFLTRLNVPTIFLLAYCMTLTYSHTKLGQYWLVYIIAFLCGCFALGITSAVARLVAAAAMYPVVYFASERMLQTFPLTAQRAKLRPSPRMDESLLTIGLPVMPGRKERRSWSITLKDALFVACVSGWLFFCIAIHFRVLPEFDNGMLQALAWVSAISIIGRLLIYTIGYAPPISILGRLMTGRIIIPGYDVVFLAPLAVAVTASILAEIAGRSGFPFHLAMPVIAGIVVWLSLALPPAREEWHLTGHHRIAYRFLAALIDRNKSQSRIYTK